MKTKVIEYEDQDGNRKKRNVSFVRDLWPLTRFFFVAPEYDKEDKFVRKNWKESTSQDMQEQPYSADKFGLIGCNRGIESSKHLHCPCCLLGISLLLLWSL